ncbi:hypothetical protein FLL45_19665 [Aliikangiella marina]|uniref:Uncharacterized protein n=1 Tax=Aliikangiella marina TaxID=1712262 RepID=A0A545T2D5_9GAMM|nr:hypothetical protein [Aliikangiella marina]TQV71376.1 hypothetical protein FLL45_19665 [Aliikangiella marina]
MSGVLQEMLVLLSEEDRAAFEQLAQKMKQVNGDVSLLSVEDRQMIQLMEAKYGEQINQTHNKANQFENFDILELPFAQHVRQLLARDLGEKYPTEEDAVRFAFENKWLPVDCQDQNLVAELYERFGEDIKEMNQWRNEMVETQSDPKMALGLAWFMIIFKLNERLNG